jgi:hypothetical protein
MKITKADKILIIILFILTLLTFNTKSFFSKAGSAALLYIDGSLVYKIDLNIDKEYELDVVNGTAKIKVTGGKLYMKESPCPRKICVSDSPVFKEGDSLICVPNKIVVKIQGKGEGKLDAFTK